MQGEAKKSRERNPESVEFDKLKGQMIRLWPAGDWNGEPIIGRLIWVASHTIGVAFGEDPKGSGESVSMVFKQGGMRIDPM